MGFQMLSSAPSHNLCVRAVGQVFVFMPLFPRWGNPGTGGGGWGPGSQDRRAGFGICRVLGISPPPPNTHIGEGSAAPAPGLGSAESGPSSPYQPGQWGAIGLGQRSQGDWGQEPEPSAKYSPTGGEAFGGQGRCATHREKRASGAALPRGHCFPDRITYSFPVTKAYQSFW